MYKNATDISRKSGYTGASHKLGKLLRVLSDDEDEMGVDTGVGSPMMTPSGEPWLEDFRGYLNSTDQLRRLMIVQWWGVRDFFNSHSISNSLTLDVRSILRGTLSGLH